MSASGSLTSYNNELVKTIEELREQREELNRSILRDEEEKARIQKVRTPAGAQTARRGHPNGAREGRRGPQR
jgi:hypothetical protein